MSLLIVDGYNIINNWPELAPLVKDDMDGARTRLFQILDDYVPLAWKKIIIVYDAYRVKGNTLSREDFGGVQVIFTPEGQSADSFIERLVMELIEAGDAVEVASSDYMEQNIILWKGGQRISARELRERLQSSRREVLARLIAVPGCNRLDERISPHVRQVLEKWRRHKMDKC